MPHAFTFAPPLRGSKGGPLLKFGMPDPALEPALRSGLMDERSSPYRKSRDVENLLDRVTCGVQPRSLDDTVLLMALGLELADRADGKGTVFSLSPGHIHKTDQAMRPDVLLEHSAMENRDSLVSIARMDELSLLAVAMMRRLGFSSFLSSVETPGGASLSGLVAIHDGEMGNFIIKGRHPPVSRLVIFEDREVHLLLSLLRAHNGVKMLAAEMAEGTVSPSEIHSRVQSLMAEFAQGIMSGHNLADLVEKELQVIEGALSLPKGSVS